MKELGKLDTHLSNCTNNSASVPLHRLNLAYQLIRPLKVRANLRNKIILLVRTSNRQSLHRILPQ